MRVVQIKTRGRRGFTLIELLVVIAIIGVLVSLLLAAVMKAMTKAEEAKARSDISQLNQAVAAWQVKFNVQGPFPSRLQLYKRFNQYDLSRNSDGSPHNLLDTDSAAFLQRVWPRLVNNGQFAAESQRVDWDGIAAEHPQGWTLQGQECLVFFLGGIPTTIGTPGCTGFATSSTDPSYHIKHPTANPPPSLIPSFFAFDSSRLVIGQTGTFFHYMDGYEKAPYAYFSSYKTTNGYNRYGTGVNNSDCTKLGVCPYAEAPGRYLNPNTFQIISAGRDHSFGQGTLNPATGTFFVKGTAMYGFGAPGYDDMSNFHDKFLGIPNE